MTEIRIPHVRSWRTESQAIPRSLSAPEVLADQSQPVAAGAVTLPPVPRRDRATGRKRLGESGGAVRLEDGVGGEAAFLVEVVEDGRVNGCELLQRSHAPEAEHGPFTFSKRLVRIFRTIVGPTADLMVIGTVEFAQRGTA
jgi:hypothetical protein